MLLFSRVNDFHSISWKCFDTNFWIQFAMRRKCTKKSRLETDTSKLCHNFAINCYLGFVMSTDNLNESLHFQLIDITGYILGVICKKQLIKKI